MGRLTRNIRPDGHRARPQLPAPSVGVLDGDSLAHVGSAVRTVVPGQPAQERAHHDAGSGSRCFACPVADARAHSPRPGPAEPEPLIRPGHPHRRRRRSGTAVTGEADRQWRWDCTGQARGPADGIRTASARTAKSSRSSRVGRRYGCCSAPARATRITAWSTRPAGRYLAELFAGFDDLDRHVNGIPRAANAASLQDVHVGPKSAAADTEEVHRSARPGGVQEPRPADRDRAHPARVTLPLKPRKAAGWSPPRRTLSPFALPLRSRYPGGPPAPAPAGSASARTPRGGRPRSRRPVRRLNTARPAQQRSLSQPDRVAPPDHTAPSPGLGRAFGATPDTDTHPRRLHNDPGERAQTYTGQT